ncbi:MAG: hypothetical protein U0L92_07675 [Clostridia bacterium]|nr:hypothetical protein [Clostridia bacterium]
MSIWLNPKGKTYASTGQNAWFKEYAERLTESLRQEINKALSPHLSGTGHRHRAEDIDFDQTTVKAALTTEAETRTQADAALESAIAALTTRVTALEAAKTDADSTGIE